MSPNSTHSTPCPPSTSKTRTGSKDHISLTFIPCRWTGRKNALVLRASRRNWRSTTARYRFRKASVRKRKRRGRQPDTVPSADPLRIRGRERELRPAAIMVGGDRNWPLHQHRRWLWCSISCIRPSGGCFLPSTPPSSNLTPFPDCSAAVEGTMD